MYKNNAQLSMHAIYDAFLLENKPEFHMLYESQWTRWK